MGGILQQRGSGEMGKAILKGTIPSLAVTQSD